MWNFLCLNIKKIMRINVLFPFGQSEGARWMGVKKSINFLLSPSLNIYSVFKDNFS